MKLSFLPADLHLTSRPDGSFQVSLRNEVVFTAKSRKAALTRFNQLRSEHGGDEPLQQPSAEERERLLRKEVGEALVDANHYEPQKLKKGRRSTRTFG